MPNRGDQGAVRIATVEGVARVATGAAVAMAAATAAAVLLSGITPFAWFLGVLCLISLTGSALFCGLHRTAAASGAVSGERVLVQGVGRGGQGFLSGHVVAVTGRSVLSISSRPWGVGRLASKIALPEISGIKSWGDSLDITDGQTTIRLKKCPPPQIEAILDELDGLARASATVI